MSIPSYCIPYLLPFVTEDKVTSVFNALFKCDCVEKVEMVPMEKNGKTFQMCFIHFVDMYVDPEISGGKWSKLDDANPFFKLAPDNKINRATGEPYFWKVFLNKSSKPNKSSGPVILE